MDPSMATRYHYHSHSHKQTSYVKVSIKDDIWIGHIMKLNTQEHRLTTREGRPEGPLLGSTEGSVLGWYDGTVVGTSDGYIRHNIRNHSSKETNHNMYMQITLIRMNDYD